MKKVKSNKINLIVYQIDSNYTEKIINVVNYIIMNVVC